jgi:peptidyl-prolyl cis-trans isomerase SurA
VSIRSSCKQLWASIILTAVCLSSYAETVLVEQIVAVVEDDIVLASELIERMEQTTEAIKAKNAMVPPKNQLAKEILDQLIEESIQLRMGRRYGVRVSDAQLNAAINRIAAANQLTLEQFRQALLQDGKSYEDMREKIRRDMIIQRVQQGNVSQRVQITDQEIANFLTSEEGQKLAEEEYHIVHALLPLAEDSSSAETARAEQHIAELYRQISKKGNFDEVVSKDSKYKFSGGDLGWRKRGALPSLFAEIAPQLEVGKTAEPLKSASGFHLVKLIEKRGGQTIIPQTHVRHILLKTTAIRTDQETREFADKLRKRAAAGENFAELAKEYSEDIGSGQEGGDLNWVSPGQMVPKFEKMMNATKTDEISSPFTSQFGWHVLQVLDRRQEDVTETVLQNMAGNHLHQRKYQDELQVWLQKIRDEAFVDIK